MISMTTSLKVASLFFSMEVLLLGLVTNNNVLQVQPHKIEYVDIIMATKEIVWLCHLLANLGYSQSTPIMFLLDNQNAIWLGSNLEFYCRTKHIDIQYHVIRQSIHLQHVSTHDQIADAFTKAPHVDKFQ